MTEQSPVRVLQVEDNPRAIEITRLYVAGKRNFKITAVLTALQALEKLDTANFDVVVSDYLMPDMDGIELLAELRRRGNKIPFIILTGKGTEDVVIEALNKGADRYIKKEGPPDVLFGRLAQYIQEVVADKREEEAQEALSVLIEEEKELKSLENDFKEQKPEEIHIDASTLINEDLDLVVLGLLVDRLADEGAIRLRMNEAELTEEIRRKFGISVDSEALHTSVIKLKEEDMITDIGGRIALIPKDATLILILKYTFSRLGIIRDDVIV